MGYSRKFPAREVNRFVVYYHDSAGIECAIYVKARGIKHARAIIQERCDDQWESNFKRVVGNPEKVVWTALTK